MPVAIILVATQQPDGSVSLGPTEGDFSYALSNVGEATVTTTVRASAADGFVLADGTGALEDGQADVWMTPATTGVDPVSAGYDPSQDDGYREHGRIALPQCEDGTTLDWEMEAGERIWLNGIGGLLGGWGEGDGPDSLLASVHWTFALAHQA